MAKSIPPSQLDYYIPLIRNSGLFDDNVYRLSARAKGENVPAGVDVIRHYLTVGEARGYRPSAKFDPDYYAETNPGLTRGTLLLHYVLYGAGERQAALPATTVFSFPDKPASTRPTAVLFLHEASRTGAPVLGWNLAKKLSEDLDLVVVLLKRGELLEEFRSNAAWAVVAPREDNPRWSRADAKRLSRILIQKYHPKFVIVNSVAALVDVAEFALSFVPTVTLVHEFAENALGHDPLYDLYFWSGAMIFPAEVVAESSMRRYPICATRGCYVVPQGRSAIPRFSDRSSSDRRPRIEPARRPAFRVVGMGFVDARKGLEFFLAAAAAILRWRPSLDFEFCWVGDGFRPADEFYSAYLQDQVHRSGLTGKVTFLGSVDDTNPIYAASDLFFLSSRLDPLPNVAIDAAFEGCPVLCFDKASGMAEYLKADDQLSELVVPYLDASAAAQEIIRLAEDRGRLEQLGQRIRSFARGRFDMDAYASAILSVGRELSQRFAGLEEEYQFVSASPLVDASFYSGGEESRNEAIREYLVHSALLNSTHGGVTPLGMRKPCAGFHPLIFEAARPSVEGGFESAFVRYLKGGQEDGVWKMNVIRPSDHARSSGSSETKAAIHGHFHYVDLLPDFLRRLSANALRCDLFITTNSAAAADATKILSKYKSGTTRVIEVPNRGRDIGAFLTGVADAVQGYDVIGHVHGKKSLALTQVGTNAGDRWREFLWTNLIGMEKVPMADRIISEFDRDASLGLVFPEVPYVVGWDTNLPVASDLAQRIGIDHALPIHFNFPVGTMFWARPKALGPLFDLGFDWGDYPDEPLPSDGTLLHALERLIPSAVAKAGYSSAVTHVPGVTR